MRESYTKKILPKFPSSGGQFVMIFTILRVSESFRTHINFPPNNSTYSHTLLGLFTQFQKLKINSHMVWFLELNLNLIFLMGIFFNVLRWAFNYK